MRPGRGPRYNTAMDAIPPQHGLAVLAGAGPGTGELTSRAVADWLARADVVVYDRLAAADLLELAPPSAERIDVGKVPGESHDQVGINRLLVEKVRDGKLVVRLKGGDPLLFGRGGEEADALAEANLPFRIEPGITAALAAAAAAGIPLTDRRVASSVALVTGHEDPDKEASAINYDALARVDSLVFYMGVKNAPQIIANLIVAGRDPASPAAIVENAARANQRTIRTTLAELPDAISRAAVRPPALLIVSPTVALADRLDWRARLPLAGRCVLVTRTRVQASTLSAVLAYHGAEVIEAPTIAIHPSGEESFAAALAEPGRFDWLVLTSPNGVEGVTAELARQGLDARALGGVKIAAIGPATADRLAEHFLTADLVPEQYRSDALAEALLAEGVADKAVLLARSNLADDALPEHLTRAGADVTAVTAYRTDRPRALPTEARNALAAGRVDWITFTSSSTAENFAALAEGADLAGAKLAAIGPVTAEAMRRVGIEPTVVADEHSIPGLLEAILHHEANSG